VLLACEEIRLDLKDQFGRTALALAAKRGNTKVFRQLLAMDGIEPDCLCSSNRAPLSYAAEGGHFDIVQQLLALKGIGVDRRDDRGRSPLSWAIDPGSDFDLAQREWSGNNIGGRMKVVKRLLRMDAVDPNAADGEGFTPLIRSRGIDSSGDMERLLRARKDLHRNCHRGRAAGIRRQNRLSDMLDAGREDACQPTEDNGVTETGSDSISQDERLVEVEVPDIEEHEQNDLGDGMTSTYTESTPEEEEGDFQEYRKDREDEELCPECGKIDFEKEFSDISSANNHHILRLRKVDQTWRRRRCQFCQIIASIHPDTFDHDGSQYDHSSMDTASPDTNSDSSSSFMVPSKDKRYTLQCLSSMSYLTRRPGISESFKATWIDTVLFGLSPRPGITASTGYIGRVGSNFPKRSNAITVLRLNPDKINFDAAKDWINAARNIIPPVASRILSGQYHIYASSIAVPKKSLPPAQTFLSWH
jgi:hypothetical protein